MILIMPTVRDALPPGPRLPFAVQTALLWTRPVPCARAWRRRYGDVFTVRAAPMGTLVYLADPAHLKAVFAGDGGTFRAGEANSLMRGVVGEESVLLLDGQRHRDSRKRMLPPFHRDAVRRQADQMAEIAAADVASWPVGRKFPVAPRMAAITLEVILRIVIGARDPARLAALRATLPGLVRANPLDLTSMSYPDLLRHRPWRGVRRRREAADRLLRAEIAARRTDPELAERTDVLAMLVREATDGGMSDTELRDQLVTLLLAGHETTATGLSWALERLTRHPDELARAVRAADEDDHEYLDALVRETLRVRPVISEVGRVLSRPTEVAGYRLPAGTMVVPSIGLVHERADLYPDPERFDPSRMLGVTPSPTTWLPFGGGGRRCLGATFAQVEMRVVLREILRAVDLETTPAPGERPRVKLVTLAPHRGARIRVGARRPAYAGALGAGALGADAVG
jgi:cytochrome P450